MADTETKTEKDKERELGIMRERFNAMRIPYEYQNCTFGNFNAKTFMEKVAYTTLAELTESHRGTVVLTGKHGIGKTHLAVATLRIIGGKFCTFQELKDWTFPNGYSKYVFEDLTTVPCLVVDDVNDDIESSDIAMDALSSIINDRRLRYLTTIITTNKEIDPTCYPELNQKSCDRCSNKTCLGSFFTNYVMSRLKQESYVIPMDMKDTCPNPQGAA